MKKNGIEMTAFIKKKIKTETTDEREWLIENDHYICRVCDKAVLIREAPQCKVCQTLIPDCHDCVVDTCDICGGPEIKKNRQTKRILKLRADREEILRGNFF